MARTSVTKTKTPRKKTTTKAPNKSNGAAKPGPEPEETPHEAEARRAEERAAKHARHVFETTAAASVRILEREQDERRSLRQTFEAPYIGQDGSADLNPKATLGDVLSELWAAAESPDNTLTEHALEDVHDCLTLLSNAVLCDDQHMVGSHVMVARFLDRVARRANLAKYLSRRIEAANAEIKS